MRGSRWPFMAGVGKPARAAYRAANKQIRLQWREQHMYKEQCAYKQHMYKEQCAYKQHMYKEQCAY
jgi:hypothetical protein